MNILFKAIKNKSGLVNKKCWLCIPLADSGGVHKGVSLNGVTTDTASLCISTFQQELVEGGLLN